MRQAPLAVRDVARRLLEQEAGELPGRETWAAAANACRKLHDHLAPMIGSDGFSTLVARALALARHEYPCLEGIQIQPGGVLAGPEDLSQADPCETHAGLMLVLANVYWLLVTFIGEDLASRLVGEVWPAAALDAAAGLEESER